MDTVGVSGPDPSAAGQNAKEEKRGPLIHDTSNPPIAQSPQGMLGEGGAGEIQGALNTHGFNFKKTGVLDDETRKAILAFQKRENLAATGMPDELTLKRLGLKPRAILNTGN